MKSKRSVNFAFLLIFSLIAFQQNSSWAEKTPEEWGTPSNGFQLGLALQGGKFSDEDPISIIIATRNADDQPHWIMQSGINDYEFILTNERGEFIRRKPDGVRLGKGMIESSAWNPPLAQVQIEPGKQEQLQTDLRTLFSLKTAGRYQLTIIRSVPDLSSIGKVKHKPKFKNLLSNSVEFSILPSTKSQAGGE